MQNCSDCRCGTDSFTETVTVLHEVEYDGVIYSLRERPLHVISALSSEELSAAETLDHRQVYGWTYCAELASATTTRHPGPTVTLCTRLVALVPPFLKCYSTGMHIEQNVIPDITKPPAEPLLGCSARVF